MDKADTSSSTAGASLADFFSPRLASTRGVSPQANSRRSNLSRDQIRVCAALAPNTLILTVRLILKIAPPGPFWMFRLSIANDDYLSVPSAVHFCKTI